MYIFSNTLSVMTFWHNVGSWWFLSLITASLWVSFYWIYSYIACSQWLVYRIYFIKVCFRMFSGVIPSRQSKRDMFWKIESFEWFYRGDLWMGGEIFKEGLDTMEDTIQSHKMVKHTETIRRQFADEWFKCVWPLYGVGVELTL